MDAYFTEEGDIVVSSSGDIALTPTTWRDDVQQAYIRMMTDIGDYLTYPELGADLSQLFGRPQSPETGDWGVRLIDAAMQRENRFIGKPYQVNAIPVSYQSIRFDVIISSGSRDEIKLSVEQSLGF